MSDERLSLVDSTINTSIFNDFMEDVKRHITTSDIARYKNLASITNLDVIEFFANKYAEDSGFPKDLILDCLDQVLNTRKILINLLS